MYGTIQTPRLPPCVKGLIIANVAVFILQLLPGGIGDIVTGVGAMNPIYAFKYLQVWRLVTYMFLHSPDMIFHILFNMLSLWWFGVELEEIWGKLKFLIFYFICGIGSGFFTLFYLFVNPHVIVIGASGAVLGLLTAYAIYYPQRHVMLFGIFPMRMRTLVIGYAVISVYFSIAGGGGNVSHIVHLGGIVVAYVYLKIAPAAWLEWNKRVYLWRSRRQIDRMTKR
ncbi:MAG: rhomboid family intramembrane serine protease [Chitinispirillales bacterium]|jgi:membrane associated rhomboid family serine protease|nr:rhomboid family intramembrane serine protease [Chitinispirillales bacterium]